jgi:hypothetical protein
MSKFIIERNIPSVGKFSVQEMQAAAQKSNDTIRALSSPVQWVHSYVTNDKLYCIYLADNVAAVQEHAVKSGFPANTVTEVKTIIDPTTAEK